MVVSGRLAKSDGSGHMSPYGYGFLLMDQAEAEIEGGV
jgi:hypothetical protein